MKGGTDGHPSEVLRKFCHGDGDSTILKIMISGVREVRADVVRVGRRGAATSAF